MKLDKVLNAISVVYIVVGLATVGYGLAGGAIAGDLALGSQHVETAFLGSVVVAGGVFLIAMKRWADKKRAEWKEDSNG